MASNQIQSMDSEETSNPVPMKDELKHNKKTVVAYRPASKAKKTSRTPYVSKTNKSPEDLHEEVIQLKKLLASTTEENSVLKAKIRRTEEENVKKNEELRRLLVDKKSSANTTINNLKQRVIKLELSLKEKEQMLKKLQGDLKATKAKEMKIQLDTYYQEIVRLKSLNQKKSKQQKDYGEDGEGAQSQDKSRDVHAPNEDYAIMNKDQLLGIISELEKKIKARRFDGLSDTKHYQDKKKLEEKLKRITEERQSFQKLAECREAEIKGLRNTIANFEKSSDKEIIVRPSISTRTPKSSSDGEKLGSIARGSSAPTRSTKQTTPGAVHESFVMSSTVRKTSSKGSDIRKTGSDSNEKGETPRLGGKRSLNKLELDLSKLSPTYDNRRALSARSNVRSNNKSSASTVAGGHMHYANDSEHWVMQATVRKRQDNKMQKMNIRSPYQNTNGGVKQSSAASKNPVIYTVLKSPDELSNGQESKFQAAGDSHPVVDFQVVEDFRQNRAAKKIQNGWKRHQKHVNEGRKLEKLNQIRNNCAARTIQQGWKKHKILKNQIDIMGDTRSLDQNIQEHDDDDDSSINQIDQYFGM